MGGLGGLYRPTPRGTMVIWPAAGPGCQCLQPPPSPPTGGPRRLVAPADWLVAAHCSRAVDDEGQVIFSVATVPPPGGRSL